VNVNSEDRVNASTIHGISSPRLCSEECRTRVGCNHWIWHRETSPRWRYQCVVMEGYRQNSKVYNVITVFGDSDCHPDGGCEFDPAAPLFHQYEDQDTEPQAWEFTLLNASQVDNSLDWPAYQWMPDGHLSTLWVNRTNQWVLFYPNSETYRSVGTTPLPDDQLTLEPTSTVLGGKLAFDSYNNGGEWLNSVHDLGASLVGFVHAEDQYWEDGHLAGGGKAFKSVSLVCSQDLGVSWSRKGQVLIGGVKPSAPAWAGIGDFDVVWDWQKDRWFMVASHLRMAVSKHKGGARGWKGWDGEGFTSNSSSWVGMRDREGQKLPNGEHPAIHWNRFVKQWVMVWNGYDGRIYISSSQTLADQAFHPARVLVEKANDQEKNWYPTLISEDYGDRFGHRHFYLYWRLFPQGPGQGGSIFMKAKVKLRRTHGVQNNGTQKLGNQNYQYES